MQNNTSQPETIKVTEDFNGTRLDRFIKRYIPGIKQSHLEKLIGSGSIRVNKKKSKPNFQLEVNQSVSIPPKLRENIFDFKLKHKYVPLNDDIEMIKKCKINEADDFLALNKPSGLPVQGGSKITKHIDGLLEPAFGKGKKFFLVHRLDRDTTGALLVAKNRIYAKKFSNYFKDNKITKKYLAIVCGKLEDKKGVIDLPLLKAKVSNEEKVIVDYDKGLKSVTKFKLLGSHENFSFVLLSPVTGRTHQLRVHLSELGFPILGDKKYGGVTVLNFKEDQRATLQLHCLQLIFPYKLNKKNIVYAEINNQMKKNINRLNLNQYLNRIEEKFLR